MFRSIVLVGLVCLVLVGCGGSAQPAAPDPQAIAEAVAATVAALPQPEQAPPVEVTRVVEVTREVQVEVTREVEVTAVPELTATPEPAILAAGWFTKTVDVTQIQGGITITVSKILIAPFAAMGSEFTDDPFVKASDYWKNATTVVVLQVSVTNTTDQTVSVYPDQGKVVVGDQQAEADVFVSQDIGGELFAGVTRSGLVMFGLPNDVDLTTLDQVRYIVNGPVNGETFSSLGEDYDLVLPLK